jgi:hypothetical protein
MFIFAITFPWCQHIYCLSSLVVECWVQCFFSCWNFTIFLQSNLEIIIFNSVNSTNFVYFCGVKFHKKIDMKKMNKKHLLGWMTRVLGLLFWTWNGNIANNNLGKTIVGVHIFGNLENINCQKTIQKKTCWNKGSCEIKIKNTKMNKSFISILTITQWLSPLVSSLAMWGRGRVRQHFCKEMNMEAKACEWEDQKKAKKRDILNWALIFFYKQIGKYFGEKKFSCKLN